MLEIPSYTEKITNTSLILSTLTKKPIKLIDINKKEPKQGLSNQNLVLAKLLTNLAKAGTENLTKESETLFFSPNAFEQTPIQIKSPYQISLPTLFTNLLPLAKKTNFELNATGTTDSDSQSLDFLKYSLLPLTKKHGLNTSMKLKKRNFFPKSNGFAKLRLKKSKLKPIKILSKGNPDYIQIITNSRGMNNATNLMEKKAKFLLKENDIEIIRNNTETKENKGASISIIHHFSNLSFFSSATLSQKRNPEKTAIYAINTLKKKIQKPIDPLFLDYLLIHSSLLQKGSFPYLKTETKDLCETFFNLKFQSNKNLISLKN